MPLGLYKKMFGKYPPIGIQSLTENLPKGFEEELRGAINSDYHGN